MRPHAGGCRTDDMTSNSARKRAVRAYSEQHGISYRKALAVLASGDAAVDTRAIAVRILIEAVEGCGIRHWARVDDWDGSSRAIIADLGGERFDLTATSLMPLVADHVETAGSVEPRDVDSYLADEIIQTGLFGCVIYRMGVRRRPPAA